MCRNIRVLHGFEPPTTPDEIAAAALQYVRKVSGTTKPAQVEHAAFERAVAEVAATTERLLAAMRPRTVPRTREGERDRARKRFERRFDRAGVKPG